MLAATVSFLTPIAGLLALVACLPLAGLGIAAFRGTHGRRRLGLSRPGRDRTGVALAVVPLLLGLAASQPAIVHAGDKHFRTDAQALFVFDVSGSMDAARGPHSPTRLQQAQAAAVELRNAIPDVPSGVATLTTQVLPELLPTDDAATFDTTVDRVLGIEEPPPPVLSYGTLGTSFDALAYVRSQGYFSPQAKHRVLVLLTDGESAPYDPPQVAQSLTAPSTAYPFSGLATQIASPVSLVVVRLGAASDHVYSPDGAVDPAYRAQPSAAATVSNLATLTHGAAFSGSRLGGAAHALRHYLGAGHEVARGRKTTTLGLGRYLALAALLAAGLVVWRRNILT